MNLIRFTTHIAAIAHELVHLEVRALACAAVVLVFEQAAKSAPNSLTRGLYGERHEPMSGPPLLQFKITTLP